MISMSSEWRSSFVRHAGLASSRSRKETPPGQLLEHLNLLNDGRPTNAAVLLFGRAPQRFLISSEIRCAHYHGTEVAKPIPSYQVYKGTAFDLVDQAVDFVLSKIYRSIGTRAESARASRTYEIPAEVVSEAIVNAVAHRDYTDNGSVQVMLFADRLEVRNPGRLPTTLTLEKLREAHSSVPGNPLLAESLYLTEYIERMGTGTLDMIRRCVEAGPAGTRVRRRRWLRDHDSPDSYSGTSIRASDRSGGISNRWRGGGIRSACPDPGPCRRTSGPCRGPS